MNSRFVLCLASITFAAATLPIAHAATTGYPAKKSPLSANVSTNPIPLSVFEIPRSPKDGRDPFFPASDRLQQVSSTNSTTTPKAPSIDLIYNGLSGTADHQLAIINGRTLAEGEETELVLPAGRVKIRCVEIKGETVIVEAFGERRELRLGAGK